MSCVLSLFIILIQVFDTTLVMSVHTVDNGRSKRVLTTFLLWPTTVQPLVRWCTFFQLLFSPDQFSFLCADDKNKGKTLFWFAKGILASTKSNRQKLIKSKTSAVEKLKVEQLNDVEKLKATFAVAERSARDAFVKIWVLLLNKTTFSIYVTCKSRIFFHNKNKKGKLEK